MPSFRLLTIALTGLLLVGCALPTPRDRPTSTAIETGQARLTPLGRATAPLQAAHPGKTGIHLLYEPATTFAALTHLIRTAQHSLDLQYYIWYEDRSGTLLLRELVDAAERGVRVRLMLDDQGTRALDAELAALDAHRNIEVRLFNPFLVREARWLAFLTRFERANRRMHNKVLIADNTALISGGRNIGDSYFGATDGFLFSDLDILAAGPVVEDVSNAFDDYWHSRATYAAEQILPEPADGVLERLGRKADALARSPRTQAMQAAVRRNRVVGDLLHGKLDLIWADTDMVVDPPTKGLGPIPLDELLTIDLRDKLGVPQQSVDIISSFFVPTPTLTKALTTLARRGVRVRVLTNSLDATDMPPAHAGYARYREPLLEAGVTLYEMRRLADRPRRPTDAGPFGSPATTLHAKAVVIDTQRVFIGSYNVDPRSVLFNTELGFVIASPELAAMISASFETHVPQSAYRLTLEDGEIVWIEQRGEERLRHHREPDAGPLKRGAAWLFSLMPIEWLL